MSLLFILVCRNPSLGTTRSTRLSDYFHALWIKASFWMFWILLSFLNPSPGPQRKGNTLCWECIRSLANLIRHTKISYFIASLVQYLPKWSTARYLRAEALQVLQKVRAVLIRYLLQGIHILVYPCTEWGTSKIYLCLEDNRSSFFRVRLKSETTDARP